MVHFPLPCLTMRRINSATVVTIMFQSPSGSPLLYMVIKHGHGRYTIHMMLLLKSPISSGFPSLPRLMTPEDIQVLELGQLGITVIWVKQCHKPPRHFLSHQPRWCPPGYKLVYIPMKTLVIRVMSIIKHSDIVTLEFCLMWV